MLEKLQVQPNPQWVIDSKSLHPFIGSELTEPLPQRREQRGLLPCTVLGHDSCSTVTLLASYMYTEAFVRQPEFCTGRSVFCVSKLVHEYSHFYVDFVSVTYLPQSTSRIWLK
jgi:hypothetical protein